MSTPSIVWVDVSVLRTALVSVYSGTSSFYSEEIKQQCELLVSYIDSEGTYEEIVRMFSVLPITKRADVAHVSVRERTNVAERDVVFYGSTSGTSSNAPLLIPFSHVDDYHFDPTFGGMIARPLIIYPPLLGSFGHSFVRQCREREVPATPIFSDFRNLHNAAIIARETNVDSIYATPTIAAAFAECCREYMDPAQIRLIALGSETVTSVQRDRISSVFPNARIVNLYASAEVGQFILVPPQQTTSNTVDEFIPITGALAALELIDGELVITYGNNSAHPLLRYATGDMFEMSGSSSDGRPIIRWLHRDGVDRVRVNGLEITVGTFDELIAKASPIPGAPRYQVRCIEQKNGSVRMEIDVESGAESASVYQQAAAELICNYLLDEWILPSGKPFSVAVDSGMFSRPVVRFVQQLPISLKAKKFIVMRDND